MTTLEEAWEWYRSAREASGLLKSLAGCWGRFPWDEVGPLPDRLRTVGEPDLVALSNRIEQPLGDLAVLVLFSVFEANVRDVVEAQLRPEVDTLKHPALVTAGQDALKAVEEGSFYRVLEPLKSSAINDLIEQVNQVRRYRNWVAHGRRPEKKPNDLVDPKTAYNRLREFLRRIGPGSSLPPFQPEAE